MSEVIEFPRPPIAFDPETVQSLSLAFDTAWEKIRESGSGFARPAYASAMREEIAKHLIGMVGAGETDQIKLTTAAIAFLAENYSY
jgi:hypothetical protein